MRVAKLLIIQQIYFGDRSTSSLKSVVVGTGEQKLI